MLLITHPNTYVPEREYVFHVVFDEFLGIPWSVDTTDSSGIEIRLKGEPASDRLHFPDVLFANASDDWLDQRTLPRPPLPRLLLDRRWLSFAVSGDAVPVLFSTLPGSELVRETDRAIEFDLDLFGGIFFQLTRYEELVSDRRDQHGRFPSAASIGSQDGFLDQPIVNQYVEILREALLRLWPRLTTLRRSFQLKLSHDVDWPFHPRLTAHRALRAMVGDVVRRRDAGLAIARARGLTAQAIGRGDKDPYFSFDFIMDVSEARGLRSSFYFMTNCSDRRFDSGYDLNDPLFGALLRQIHDRGHEIGLHPSYGSYRDPDLLHTEFDALLKRCSTLGIEQPEWGGRQHFLRWENPGTWRAWAQVGLTYDSSLGFSDTPAFRSGVCFEHSVFDLQARRRLALRERPLIVMEMAVVDKNPNDFAAIEATVAVLKERCRRYGGDFTLLWHNSRLASKRQRDLYASVV